MKISNRWLGFILILPHVNIYYFNLEGIKDIIFIWQIMIILVAFYLLFKLKETTKFILMVILFIISMSFSSFVNSTISFGIIFSNLILLSLCIYISEAIKEPKEFFKGMYYLFSLVIYLNFITILFQGINEQFYLLGGKNSLSMTLIIAMCFVMIYTYITFNKMTLYSIIVIAFAILSIILTGSGTGIVIAILFTCLLLMQMLQKKYLPSFKQYMSIYLLLYAGIVVFRLQDTLFENFIVNVLNKTTNFTGRTFIWDFVIDAIGESWLLGFGRGTSLINEQFPNLYESHNGFLEILVYSGLIGLVFFLVILIQVGKQLDQYNQFLLSKIIAFSIFSYMVVGLTESVFLKKEFWMLLVVGYSIGYLSSNNVKNCSQSVHLAK